MNRWMGYSNHDCFYLKTAWVWLLMDYYTTYGICICLLVPVFSPSRHALWIEMMTHNLRHITKQLVVNRGVREKEITLGRTFIRWSQKLTTCLQRFDVKSSVGVPLWRAKFHVARDWYVGKNTAIRVWGYYLGTWLDTIATHKLWEKNDDSLPTPAGARNAVDYNTARLS
jgi:hypothetical protein